MPNRHFFTRFIKHLVDNLTLVFIAGLTSVFLLQILARFFWWAELFTHFYLQYFLISLVTGLICFVRRKTYRLSVAVVLIMLFSIQLLPYYYHNRASAQIESNSQMTILLSNFHYNNTNFTDLAQLVNDYDPDLIALVEMPKKHFDPISQILPQYSHTYQIQDRDHQGLAVLSKYPFSQEPQAFWPDSDKFPVLSFVPTLPENPFPGRFFLIHPPPPLTQPAADSRNATFDWLESYLPQQVGPIVVMGDFNSTSWSPEFVSLIQSTHLRDSRANKGLQPSWPTWAAKPLRITIDHLLVSPEISVVDRQVLPSIGSDHFPVLIQLAY